MHIFVRKFSILAILSLLLTSIITCNVFAKDDDTKLKSFIEETQRSSKTAFVWWLPQEYWKTTAEQFAPSSKETALMEIYSEYFRPYIVMLVAHTKPSSSKKGRFFSESDIISNIRLIDERGFSHYPLTKKQINPGFQKFLKTLKPNVTESFGTLGEHMYFVVFAAEDNNGLIVNTAKETQFKIKINQEELSWKLPFESLIPFKVCPNCQQNLHGKFKFCPWDGTPLY